MSYGDYLKQLKKKLPLAAGDKIIKKLSDTPFAEKWQEIIDMHFRMAKLAKELDTAKELADAKMTLFWADIKDQSEQAATADERGRVLALRHDKDGNLVLVEFVEKKQSRSDILKNMFGISEEDND